MGMHKQEKEKFRFPVQKMTLTKQEEEKFRFDPATYGFPVQRMTTDCANKALIWPWEKYTGDEFNCLSSV